MSEEDQDHDGGGGGGGVKHFLSHLSPKQKLIGGALVGVVGVGIYSASRRGTAIAGNNTPAVTVPDRVQIPVPIMIPGPPSGGTLPPVLSPGRPPVLSPGRPPVLSPPTDVLAPVDMAPAPFTPVTVPFVPSPGSVPRAYVPVSYPGVSTRDAGILTRRDTAVATLINDSRSLTPGQANDLRLQVAQLDKTPVVANAANSTAAPLAGFGGGDYNKDGPAVAYGIYQNEQMLLASAAFRQAEIQRTAEVTTARQAAGVSTAAQDNYRAHLYDVGAQAGYTASSGASSSRSPSPNPTPTVNIYAPVGAPTISRATYNSLLSQVIAGGAGAEAALSQLSGKVIA